jgi:predicted RNA-binding Zn-ribbon protein involved in translation (DUF1610 family)
MSDYIRLSEPPYWCIQYPLCSACSVALETEGDGWTCPVCGTSWDMRANDGDTGTLYAEWAGEEATGPIVPEADAYRWGDYYERLERHRRMPEFCPEPKRPASAATKDSP